MELFKVKAFGGSTGSCGILRPAARANGPSYGELWEADGFERVKDADKAVLLNRGCFAYSSFAAVVRPNATSNSLSSGTSIAAIVKPKAAASVRNGTSGSAESSVPGFAMRTFVTQ
jgi:hypothetical protein